MGLKATSRDLTAFLNIVKGKGTGVRGVMDFLSHDFLFSEQIIIDQLMNIQSTFVKGVSSSQHSKEWKGGRNLRATRDQTSYKNKRSGGYREGNVGKLYSSEQQQERIAAGEQDVEVYQAPAFDPQVDMGDIKDFARALMKAMSLEFNKIKDTRNIDYNIVPVEGPGILVIATIQDDKLKTQVYRKLADALSAAQKGLKDDFKDIFYRASKRSPEQSVATGSFTLAELGHRTSVAETHKHLVDSILNNMSPKLKDSDFGKNLTNIRNSYSERLEIDSTEEMHVVYENGEITMKRKISGDFESWWKNLRRTAGPKGEAAIKRAVYSPKTKDEKESGLLYELQQAAEKAVKKSAKELSDEEGSIPLGILVGGFFTQLPSIKRLRKKRWVKGGKPFTHKPKGHRPVTTTGEVKSKSTFIHHDVSDLVRGFGAFPKPPPQRPAKSTNPNEEVRDYTRMTALINQKLGQRVLGNMGHPGLVNRTGTFANSVRVNSVTPTASGVPSIDYTYQRDPYEVFELERGRRPWATAQRDPTTIIDKSIREIAAEMAIAKLTTRRL